MAFNVLTHNLAVDLHSDRLEGFVDLLVDLVELSFADVRTVFVLFLFLDAYPQVVAKRCPNFAVDFHVHLLVQLLRQFKFDLVDFEADKYIIVELLLVLGKSLDLRIVFEVFCPLSEGFDSKAFLVIVSARLGLFQDLMVLGTHVCQEFHLNSVFRVWIKLFELIEFEHHAVIARVHACVLQVQLLEKDCQVLEAVFAVDI